MNRSSFLLLALSVWLTAHANDLLAAEETEIETIDLSELPDPPPAIAELIESAKVKFIIGPQEKATTNARFQSDRLGTGRKVAGLTEYRVCYRFRSYNRWSETIQNKSDHETDKEVKVTAEFLDLGLDRSHTVWLRDRPSVDAFWTDRVVLHELDHIRISNDPMLEKRFSEKVQEHLVFTKRLGVNESFSNRQGNRIVKQHVADTFAEIADLIEIRYQELDRLTDHGIDELPKDSTLDAILR